MAWAIETTQLTKRFPTPQGLRGFLSRKEPARPAVNGIDLRVQQGELFGLLGPNGAGKTTLIKLLCTLILPTSGSARVNGYDLKDEAHIKASTGLGTSDERSFYWRLSGRKNLEFFAALHGLDGSLLHERVELALEQVDLMEAAEKSFQAYSTGMRQRLSIARALLTRPRLLFLDEPSKGLDPTASRQLHHLIRIQLIEKQGMTVFVTTHDLEEASQLCDRIAVMQHGRLRGCGTLPELRDALDLKEKYHLVLRCPEPGFASALVSSLPGVAAATPDASANGAPDLSLTFEAQDEDGRLEQVIDTVRAQGGRIRSLTRQAVSLETIFDQLTSPVELTPGADSAASSNGKRGVFYAARQASAGIRQSLQHSWKFFAALPQPAQIWGAFSLASLRRFGRVAGAFVRRDFQEEISYKLSFFLQFFGIFFSAALFYFISLMFGNAAAPYLSEYGGNYFSFVLIGIAFSGYFGVGLSSFASSLRQAQTTGTLEAMLTTPTGLSTIILSSSLWSYLMTTFRVVVYLAMGGLFLGVSLGGGNYLAALLTLVLTVVAFASMGIIAASFIMVFKRGDPITWMFSSVSSLLGGIYYPIAVLPEWLQFFARFLPITYSLDAMRKALLMGAPVSQLLPELLILALFCVLLLPTSLLAFQYAVRRARYDGSLTHY